MSRTRNRRPLFAASSIRPARRDGTCSLCPKPIRTGQTVGLLATGWVHLP